MNYTKDMAIAMRKLKKPFPFTLDVADDGRQLNLLLYKGEFDRMSPKQQMEAVSYVSEVAFLLESYGPQVNIQGVPGEPRRL